MASETLKDTVCVTGGSGGIGQALLEQLVPRYHVKALFRTKNATSDYWEDRGCTAVWGDLSSAAALCDLVRGARYVFHCAAVVAGPYDASHTVNVEGTRRIARAAANERCKRFIHVSSIAVYSGTPAAAEYTEDAALAEHDEMAVYSRTKLQAERAVKDIASESGLEHTILRPTSVYGPNTKPYTIIPVEMIRKGLPVVLGHGRGLLDVVFVEDVAKALVAAAESPRACGETFNIGHETVSFNHFYAYYARMLNRRVRHVPGSLLNGVSRLLDLLRRSPELRNGVRFLIKMSENTSRFPSDKARALLGYTPKVNLPSGMLQTELWLKRKSLVPVGQSVVEGYGPLPFSPLMAVHPETEAEIVQVIQTAERNGLRVKAIGSLHSTCPVPYTDGICVVLDKYNKLLKVDGSLVTVQGGMKLSELNDTLARLKLALPTNGSITAQTAAGAISTATHGGSVHYASLSDYVEAVRLVKADGSVLDIDRSHDLFPAVVVSVGLLGIFSTVTFRCVPACVLQSRNSVMKAQAVIDRFDELTRRNLHTNMFYFPVTDDIEILAIEKAGDAGWDDDVMEPRLPVNSPFRQTVATLALKAFAWVLLRHNAVQRFATGFSVGAAYQPRTGRSDRVLAISDVGTSGRAPTLIRDMEIAVRYEDAPAAISALRDHFAATGKYPLLPIHIRCAARSDLWLSPAYKRDVCWFEFWQYPRNDRLFERIHELLRPFGYRFHWGKETRADWNYIRCQYEKWDDFVRLRDKWDPKGMFLNAYLEPFFKPAGSADS